MDDIDSSGIKVIAAALDPRYKTLKFLNDGSKIRIKRPNTTATIC